MISLCTQMAMVTCIHVCNHTHMYVHAHTQYSCFNRKENKGLESVAFHIQIPKTMELHCGIARDWADLGCWLYSCVISDLSLCYIFLYLYTRICRYLSAMIIL